MTRSPRAMPGRLVAKCARTTLVLLTVTLRVAPVSGATATPGAAARETQAAQTAPTAPAPTATRPPVTIASVTLDAGTNTVTIVGTELGTRPLVTLDLIPLTVPGTLAGVLQASAPLDAIPPGTYLLTVSRGSGAEDSASVDARVGERAATDTPALTVHAASLGLPSDAVAARVGASTISVSDVDRRWEHDDPTGFLSANRIVYEARRRAATALAEDSLLTHVAAAEQTTVEALLAKELPAHTVPLPDAAVTALYQGMRDRLLGASLEQMRPALRAWLARHAEPDLARMTYLDELRNVAERADVVLTPPRVDVPVTADDPVLGSAMAPVQLVVYGDITAPEYARLATAFGRVRDLFGARVQIAVKLLAAQDSATEQAVVAARCALAQGKFWEFHGDLLGTAGSLTPARLTATWQRVGVDVRAATACAEDPATRARVRRDQAEAARLDIQATPSVLVNGQLAGEMPAFLSPFDYLKRLVEGEVARQSTATAREASEPPGARR